MWSILYVDWLINVEVNMNLIKELIYRIRGEYSTEKLIKRGL